MLIHRIFIAHTVPRYRRRKMARFLHKLSPDGHTAACLFILGMLAGIGLSKLLRAV
jgi:hypothetical protein